MRQRAIAMGICLALAFGVNLSAQKKDAVKIAKKDEKVANKALPETMKAIPPIYMSLKKNLDAKDAAASSKDAQALADLFKATDYVWAKAKFVDAATTSKEVQDAAKQILAAVKANKFEDTTVAYATVVKSCSSCHAAHREKLPDGTFKMK